MFCLGLIFIAASCKSYSKTTVTTDVLGPTVIQKPVIVDLDVKEIRVSGTATDRRSTPDNELKQAALNDAITKSGADVIVEPRYEIITKGSKSTVNVTGYPATYKNFRPMEVQDSIFINKAQLNSATKSNIKRNGKRNKAIGFTLGGIAAAVGIFFLVVIGF